jgi:hypothetical protein
MILVKPGKIERMLASLPTGPDVIRNFKIVELRVAHLIKEYPECTGSRNLLVDRYRWKYHGVKFPDGYWDKKLWKHWPSPETITRAYRKLKENGGIQETLKSQLREGITEQAYKGAMPLI